MALAEAGKMWVERIGVEEIGMDPFMNEKEGT